MLWDKRVARIAAEDARDGAQIEGADLDVLVTLMKSGTGDQLIRSVAISRMMARSLLGSSTC